jgi:putative hydrolase of the HAD superfamily
LLKLRWEPPNVPESPAVISATGAITSEFPEVSMLKAVTFDLWGTLIKEKPEGTLRAKAERIRRIGEVLRSEQIIMDPAAIGRAYAAVGERLVPLWETHRDIGARGQVELLLDILQIDKSVPRAESMMDRLVEAYTHPILSELPVPINGAPDVLATLDSRGLRLAVICNTGRTPGKILRIILERLNLSKHLSVQTFSDELGLRKPRPEIFEHTLAALGVKHQEALHVGDTLASDIAGALALGMRAVHFCHPFGADPSPAEGQTISSLPELLALIDNGDAFPISKK